MLIRRLDDYQSWMIEVAGKKVAIDPWLREELVLPPGAWMFARRRALPGRGPEEIRGADALVLTGPFGDHCDPETLSVLPRDLPVFANAATAKRARKLGFTNLEVMADGKHARVFDGLSIEGVAPAFPYSSDSLGYLFSTDGGAVKRVYHETHVVDLRHKDRLRDLDAMIIPVQLARMFVINLAMSPERARDVVAELAPARVIATGTDPQIATGFMQRWMLSFRGRVEEFGALLAASPVGGRTQFSPLASGETLAIA